MGAYAWVHAQHVKTCTQLGEVYKPSYLGKMKSDIQETFSKYQDWSHELIYNVRRCAPACVHAQRVKTCTHLGEVYKPSYLGKMKSDIHETFSKYQDLSPELIYKVRWCARACVHAQRVNTYTQLGAVYKPSYLGQMKSDIHENFCKCQDGSPELIYNAHCQLWILILTKLAVEFDMSEYRFLFNTSRLVYRNPI